MIGQTISHYRVLEKIGRGGMGEVYLAEDARLGRKVALKFLPDDLQQDETARRRFLREAKSAAAIDHPYICKIYDVGEHQGQTLKEGLAAGPLGLREAVQIAREIAEALEEAQGRNIVHRDLKPSNIMLDRGGHAKVMGFGLAKRVASTGETQEDTLTSPTQFGLTMGTSPTSRPNRSGERRGTLDPTFFRLESSCMRCWPASILSGSPCPWRLPRPSRPRHRHHWRDTRKIFLNYFTTA